MNSEAPNPTESPVELASRILLRRIHGVRQSLIEIRRLKLLAWVLGLAVVVTAAMWLALARDVEISPWTRAWIHLGLVAAAAVAWWWGGLRRWSALDIARRVESARPDLNMGLITAIEKLGDVAEQPSYLTEKLLDQTVLSGARFDWTAATTKKDHRHVTTVLVGIIIALLVSEAGLISEMWPARSILGEEAVVSTDPSTESTPGSAPWEVAVTPGDAEVEKGTRVVVEATFTGNTPAEATLVLVSADPTAEAERIQMQAGIEGAVFGSVLSEVVEDTVYRIEAAGHQSRDFHLSVFEYPALVRCDLTITPPAYTGDGPKTIEKAMKATLLEGSSVRIDLTVNKPMAAAELFGSDESIVPLNPVDGEPTRLTATIEPEKSIKYRVHLVDDDERANRNPPWIDLKVRSNQLPKIEVVFPKRDLQVSPIQELPLEAKVSDELGVKRSGLVYTLAGDTRETVFDHPPTEPKKSEHVRSLLKLEEAQAQPRQLLSYYFWAEDEGPGGEVRRAMSDMFFAEVRHFEDIFREAEAPPSQPGEPPSQSDKLVDLQKQVVNATWRIIRDVSGGKKMEAAVGDVGVVAESQEIALNQVKEAMEETDDPEMSEALANAWKSMRDALEPLQQARDEAKRSPLNQALEFEQSALEWLQRAQGREHQVARMNQPPQGGAGQQQQKQELSALELKQDEKRYEEERQATPEATAEQQENLQVLARLKELARRQEALAKKMQELEEKMRNAESEEEKQELASQLKQLQAEQEQLLRDLDDLGQKMDEATNPESMAEARDQLDETRGQVLDAAEELEQQRLAQASQSATRAQRQLQQMEEDFRQRTSSQFAEDARRLKDQARELAERQEAIHEALENQPAQQSATDPGDTSNDLERLLSGADVSRALEEQGEKLDELMNGLRELSEQAEVGEPLLSRKVYEAVREAQTRGIEENLDDARYQTKYGRRSDAVDSERKVAQAMEQLSKDVAEAAETVLGSEAESLRMARSELDRLIEEAEKETQGLAGEPGKTGGQSGETTPPTNEPPEAGGQPGESGDNPPELAGEPGESGNPSQRGKDPADSNSPTGKGNQPSPKGQSTASSASPDGKPGESGSGSSPSPAEQPDSQPSQTTASAGQPAGDSPAKGRQGQEPSTPGNPSSPSEQSGSPSSSASTASTGSPSQSSPQGSPSPSQGARAGGQQGTADSGGNSRSTAGGGGFFFDAPTEEESAAPITGNGFNDWADRLRTVSELLDEPVLRNDAARILDDARAMRVENRRNNEPPQVEHLQNRITQPLMELRDRVIEELARQNADDPTVPIDRDPVPPEYQDLVRRYYTELGRGR